MYIKVTKEDLRNISHGLQSKNLKKLVLSGNELKGCIKYLLGDESHLRVSYLEDLSLEFCSLCTEDVISISDAIRDRKFPNITHIPYREGPGY